MYELFLIACVGAKICQYITAPIDYPTIARCQMAASLAAGRVGGSEDAAWPLKYEFQCTPKTRVADLREKRG